jgi:hypothetical protein
VGVTFQEQAIWLERTTDAVKMDKAAFEDDKPTIYEREFVACAIWLLSAT